MKGRRARRASGMRFSACGVAILVSVIGCSGGTDLSQPDRDALDPMVISGGSTAGIYYSYGNELADALGAEFGIRASVLETGGSIENLRNLSAGDAQLAFVAGDAAADAVAGRGAFAEPLPVRAVARVYDDFVHLVVPRDSHITSLADLEGQKVSLGAEGSGTELIAGRLLESAGTDPSAVDNTKLGLDQSISALRAGEIEAFFWSGGLPTPSVEELSEQFPVRLVSLNHLVEQTRNEFGGGYRHGVVPEGTYGLREDVRTMAVPNFLMARADLSDEAVYAITEALLDNRSEIAMNVPAATLLDRAKAIFTEPVDLHPGAMRYYRETKT